jgi:hypothetical protein
MTFEQPPPAPNPLAAAAPITRDRNSEARRAYREARTAISLLDFARRVRKGSGADAGASGATRIAGSRNLCNGAGLPPFRKRRNGSGR